MTFSFSPVDKTLVYCNPLTVGNSVIPTFICSLLLVKCHTGQPYIWAVEFGEPCRQWTLLPGVWPPVGTSLIVLVAPCPWSDQPGVCRGFVIPRAGAWSSCTVLYLRCLFKKLDTFIKVHKTTWTCYHCPDQESNILEALLCSCQSRPCPFPQGALLVLVTSLRPGFAVAHCARSSLPLHVSNCVSLGASGKPGLWCADSRWLRSWVPECCVPFVL